MKNHTEKSEEPENETVWLSQAQMAEYKVDGLECIW